MYKLKKIDSFQIQTPNLIWADLSLSVLAVFLSLHSRRRQTRLCLVHVRSIVNLAIFSHIYSSIMSYFQRLPLELTDAILDYLDARWYLRAKQRTATVLYYLRATQRTARFLRHPSERKLYRRIDFDVLSFTGRRPVHVSVQQARFFDTVSKNDRLASYVVRLQMLQGLRDPTEEEIRTISRGMEKLVNLKQLSIRGEFNARLSDPVPFQLTHLAVISSDCDDYSGPSSALLSILQAHTTIEALTFRFLPETELPPDLISALKAEQQDGLTPRNRIICPNLKRFEGYDEAMMLFLPLRKIEVRTIAGHEPKDIDTDDDPVDVWLAPAFIESYKHLRVLEVWPERPERDRRHFLPVIAPFLTSLTHFHLQDDLRILHPTDPILLSLGRIPRLQSVTLSQASEMWRKPSWDAPGLAQMVCTVCPNVQEIFVKNAEGYWASVIYCRYTKGGVYDSSVDDSVACKPYATWLYVPE